MHSAKKVLAKHDRQQHK